MIRLRRTAAVTTVLIAGALAPSSYARDPANVLMPENPEARAFQEAVGYATAVIAGDTIYLSGVVAGPADGESGRRVR